MFLWATKGRRLCQVAQKCLCQKSNIYAQQTVTSLQYNEGLSPKNVSISYTALNKRLILFSSCYRKKYESLYIMSEKNYSSLSDSQQVPETPKLSNKDKLKRAVKDYGATVIVFHVTISLMSLGVSYLAVSSGLDVSSLLDKMGFSSKSDIATGASTFVVAYAVHKVFAPVRISITLGCTPFIVRYLRRVGILKPPKSSGS